MQEALQQLWEDFKSISLAKRLYWAAFMLMVFGMIYSFVKTEWPERDFKKMIVEVR